MNDIRITDIPIGWLLVTGGVIVAVIAVCVTCCVAWWPSVREELRYWFSEPRPITRAAGLSTVRKPVQSNVVAFRSDTVH